MKRISWWCNTGQCFSCSYTRCEHSCHVGQLESIAPEQLANAADQAREDLERYFRTSTSWRNGYGHASMIGEAAS